MKNSRLANLLRENKILKHGQFKLRSGRHSSYYCDIRETFGNVKILGEIIKEIIPLIPKETTCIAGSGLGGIALASIVAYKKKLPVALVRNEVKDHGTKKTIEGYLPTKNDCVCIVDDVFMTGSSISDTKQKLTPLKCKFTKHVVVINRSEKNTVFSVLRGNDLIK